MYQYDESLKATYMNLIGVPGNVHFEVSEEPIPPMLDEENGIHFFGTFATTHSLEETTEFCSRVVAYCRETCKSPREAIEKILDMFETVDTEIENPYFDYQECRLKEVDCLECRLKKVDCLECRIREIDYLECGIKEVEEVRVH